MLGLLERPDGGSLRLAGADPWALGDRGRAQLRNRALGFVFQTYSLVPHLSAAENVALPMGYGAVTSRRRTREAVGQALEDVGLTHRSRSRPRQLSGGEQQRVAIARALVREPAVVLADEPTGALDTATAERVLDLLLTVTRSRGAALLLVTHDAAVAERADAVLRLHQGRLVPSEGEELRHPSTQDVPPGVAAPC